MDNQHRLIPGYRDMSQSEIDAINSIKLAEQDIGQLFQQIRKLDGTDQETLAIAKVKLQEAFSWFVRAVAKPLDVYELYIEPAPEPTEMDRVREDFMAGQVESNRLEAFMQTPGFACLPEPTKKFYREYAGHINGMADRGLWLHNEMGNSTPVCQLPPGILPPYLPQGPEEE